MKKLVYFFGLLILSCSPSNENTGVNEQAIETTFIVGSYNDATSNAIVELNYNSQRNTWEESAAISGIANPSFLKYSEERKMLFAVSEVDDGQVYAYQKVDTSGVWRQLGKTSSGGSAPCHLDLFGEFLYVANYSSGNLSVIKVADNGKLETIQTVEHAGSSVVKDRQGEPHVHAVNVNVSQRKLYVTDLGTDELVVYDILENGKLERAHSFKVKAGSGPRHLTFHPRLPLLYVVNELNSTVTVLEFTSSEVKEKQSISTLPPDVTERNYCADIHILPNGKHLYASNRGHETLAHFSVGIDGLLTAESYYSTLGSWPRNFGIHPSGEWLFAANQKTNNIVAYAIDSTGALSPQVGTYEMEAPVCIQFLP